MTINNIKDFFNTNLTLRPDLNVRQLYAERECFIDACTPRYRPDRVAERRSLRMVELVVLPQVICFCGLWPSFRAFVGPFVDLWIASRLTKSGIEYVILAGSSLFPMSRAEPSFWSGLVASWRAQRAIFEGFLTFWLRKVQKFSIFLSVFLLTFTTRA